MILKKAFDDSVFIVIKFTIAVIHMLPTMYPVVNTEYGCGPFGTVHVSNDQLVRIISTVLRVTVMYTDRSKTLVVVFERIHVGGAVA